MRRHDFFRRRFVQAADLPPHGLLVTIESVSAEEIGGEPPPKPVVRFSDHDQQLVVNQTNFDVISEIAGDGDTDKWAGVKIVLFAAPTTFNGRSVKGTRVRAPQEVTKPPPKPANPQLDDDIPF